MPIYVYQCESCHCTQEVLQKISDPVLVHCPHCHQNALKKQVTAAGFQLKGTGWYVTDFRDKHTQHAPDTPPSKETKVPTEEKADSPKISDKSSASTPTPSLKPAIKSS